LPFRETDLAEDEYRPYIVTTYLPDGTHHRLKRACEKAGVNLVSKPGVKLKDMLCSNNKTQHEPSKKPGVYQISCSCSPSAKYVGQTIRPIELRGKEHQRAANNGNWSHSGISQHRESCNAPIEWKPQVITTMSNKNKRRLTYDLKVREALEIRKRNCGPGQGLNEDFGAYVKTSMWNPVLHRMGND